MTQPFDPHSPTTEPRLRSRATSEGERSETTQPRDVDALLRKQARRAKKAEKVASDERT